MPQSLPASEGETETGCLTGRSKQAWWGLLRGVGRKQPSQMQVREGLPGASLSWEGPDKRLLAGCEFKSWEGEKLDLSELG